VACLLAAVGFVIFLTGVIVAPRWYYPWRERTLQEAFDNKTGPASWWPAGWRQEYARHVKLADELPQSEKVLGNYAKMLAAAAEQLELWRRVACDHPPGPDRDDALSKVESLKASLKEKQVMASEVQAKADALRAEFDAWR
jgi:hypothetical protein